MINLHSRAMPRLLSCIFAIAFISGVTAGSLFARFSADGIIAAGAEGDAFPIFLRSFSSFLRPCFLIWLFGFTGFSEYISSGVLAYRGALFGFVNTCIFNKMGFAGGIGAALAASLPHNLVFFPFLLFLSLIAASKRKSVKTAAYIIIFILSILISAFSALIDTYITSYFIRILL